MSSATPHRIDPPSTTEPSLGGPHLTGHLCRPNSAEPAAQSANDPQPAVAEPGEHAVAGIYRVDTPHTISSRENEGEVAVPTPQEWLTLHATELIDRLQAWEIRLDAREAQLNARTALQDHRERRFRLQRQDSATELAEQRRSIERLRREIEAQARRLAFRSDSPSE